MIDGAPVAFNHNYQRKMAMLNALLTFAGNYPGFALLIVTAIGCVLIPGIRERGKYGTWAPFWIRASVLLALVVVSVALVVLLQVS